MNTTWRLVLIAGIAQSILLDTGWGGLQFYSGLAPANVTSECGGGWVGEGRYFEQCIRNVIILYPLFYKLHLPLNRKLRSFYDSSCGSSHSSILLHSIQYFGYTIREILYFPTNGHKGCIRMFAVTDNTARSIHSPVSLY